jgi:hypothetical protein
MNSCRLVGQLRSRGAGWRCILTAHVRGLTEAELVEDSKEYLCFAIVIKTKNLTTAVKKRSIYVLRLSTTIKSQAL